MAWRNDFKISEKAYDVKALCKVIIWIDYISGIRQ